MLVVRSFAFFVMLFCFSVSCFAAVFECRFSQDLVYQGEKVHGFSKFNFESGLNIGEAVPAVTKINNFEKAGIDTRKVSSKFTLEQIKGHILNSVTFYNTRGILDIGRDSLVVTPVCVENAFYPKENQVFIYQDQLKTIFPGFYGYERPRIYTKLERCSKCGGAADYRYNYYSNPYCSEECYNRFDGTQHYVPIPYLRD